MRRVIERNLLRYFGIEAMPEYWSHHTREFKEDVKFAVLHEQMLVLSGDVGAGKSMLFRSAVNEMKPTVEFIYVRNFFKEKLTISNILNAIIFAISDESPRRDLEARSTQTVRLMGTFHEDTGKQLCVVIEEAHRLHANTLRALKELREAEFAGRSPLFSAVLIGHPELLVKMQTRKEAYWRSHTIELNEKNGWMNLEERERYIKHIFGKGIEQKTIRRIATLTRTPLQMDFMIEQKLREAKKLGKTVVDAELVQPTALEMKDAYDFSVSEIAKETELARSTVHDALHDESHKQNELVKKALDRMHLLKRKAG